MAKFSDALQDDLVPGKYASAPKLVARNELSLGRFADRIVATRQVAGRDAEFAPLPTQMHPLLINSLQSRGITQLYCHQTESFGAALNGENAVITTGTASGKSLAYLLPVIQSVLDDPSARSILLFPTKALTQDQLRGVLSLVDPIRGVRVEAGVYDGDTPPAERVRIRDKCNLVLTNPDMLNAALLPSHGRQGFAHIFRNVRYIVLDELHTYRGAFGAHFANLMRRLLRICAHYGSKPQFLCSSATIANAKEHAETLCHRPFRLIDRDGSPSAGKIVHFWQPPLLENGMRKSVTVEMSLLLPHLVQTQHRSIGFCRSRKETEIVLKESRDRLSKVAGSHDESYLLAGYRGGYTPKERREVEKSLVEGRLLGVVSTNALELGIDIGALQVVVQGGYPGTRASFWQQMGRAGRRGEVAHAILILALSPEDTYIAENPDWLLGQPAEHAVVDRDNLAIQLAHVRAAAAELPLCPDDAALFPDLGEILPVLHKAGEVRDIQGNWHWHGGPFPAGEFSLRNLEADRFKIVNRLTGKTITEMDRPQVYREAHTRAVYLHDGVQYQIETLDLVSHTATVVPVEQNFYTQPDVRSHIDVLLTQEQKPLASPSAVVRSHASFGDVRVDEAVVGYKMLEFHNHQNLGYEALHEPLRLSLETEGVWIPIPEAVLKVLGKENQDTLVGMVQPILACARMRTMAERSDLRGTSFHYVDELNGKTRTALICYDSHPGGLGYAAKSFDYMDAIVDGAIELVARCPCRNGCPACTGDYVRDKVLIHWALQSLREAMPVPAVVRSAAPTAHVIDAEVQDKIAFEQLPARWQEVLDRLKAAGTAGANVLATLPGIDRHENRLRLLVPSPGLADWLRSEPTHARLRQGLAQMLIVPKDWQLVFEVIAGERDRVLHRAIKVQRRHDDIVQQSPTTEKQANTKLAAGYTLQGDYVVPSDDSVN